MNHEYSTLFLFVEGPDDENFVKSAIVPKLPHKHFKVIKYAQLHSDKIESLLKVIRNDKNADYIFFCDMDARGSTTLCVTQRKQNAANTRSKLLDFEKIIVMKDAIESSYLAGASESFLASNGIKTSENTESLTKAKFLTLKPKSFSSIIDFKLEMLKSFSWENGIARNSSLKYIHRKFL